MEPLKKMQVEGKKTVLDFAGMQIELGITVDSHFSHVPHIGMEFHPPHDRPMDSIRLMDVVHQYLRKKDVNTLTESPNEAPDRPKTYYVILSNNLPNGTEVSSERLLAEVVELFAIVAPHAVRSDSSFSSALTQLEAYVAAMPEPSPEHDDMPSWMINVIQQALDKLPADLRSSFESDKLAWDLAYTITTAMPNLDATISRKRVIDVLKPVLQEYFPGNEGRGKGMYIAGEVASALYPQLNMTCDDRSRGG